jgi:hypothetical protein
MHADLEIAVSVEQQVGWLEISARGDQEQSKIV